MYHVLPACDKTKQERPLRCPLAPPSLFYKPALAHAAVKGDGRVPASISTAPTAEHADERMQGQGLFTDGRTSRVRSIGDAGFTSSPSNDTYLPDAAIVTGRAHTITKNVPGAKRKSRIHK